MTKLKFKCTFKETKNSPGYPNFFTEEIKDIERVTCCDLDKEDDIHGIGTYYDSLCVEPYRNKGAVVSWAYELGDGYEYQSIKEPKYCYNCGAKHEVEYSHEVKRFVKKTRKVKKIETVEQEVEVDEEYEVLE